MKSYQPIFRLCLILLFFAAFAESAMSAKIDYDRIENGVRVVATEKEFIESKNDIAISVSISAVQRPNSSDLLYLQIYLATLKGPIGYPANARLLIKNTDGEVVELTSDERGANDEIGHDVWLNDNRYHSYSISPLFSIDDEIISKLSKGIIKIRFELSNSHVQYCEYDFKKDKTWKKLSKHLELINKTLSTNKPSTSFDEGF